MKLLYSTNNIKGVQSYINNKLSSFTNDRTAKTPNSANVPVRRCSDNYIFVILEIDKCADDYLIDDMKHILMLNIHGLSNIKIIETISSYYMSISLADMHILSTYENNSFAIKLTQVVNTVDRFDVLRYQIPSRHNIDVHLIDDMRHFTHSYLDIIDKTDLTREDLNTLMRFTIYTRIPIKTAIAMSSDMMIDYDVNKCYHHLSNSEWTDSTIQSSEMLKHYSYRLDNIAVASNISAKDVVVEVTPNKILSLMDMLRHDIPMENRLNMTTLSNKCDAIMHNTISEIIEFANDEIYGYIYNDIIKYLTYNVNIAEFILTGKVRS